MLYSWLASMGLAGIGPSTIARTPDKTAAVSSWPPVLVAKLIGAKKSTMHSEVAGLIAAGVLAKAGGALVPWPNRVLLVRSLAVSGRAFPVLSREFCSPDRSSYRGSSRP